MRMLGGAEADRSMDGGSTRTVVEEECGINGAGVRREERRLNWNERGLACVSSDSMVRSISIGLLATMLLM